MELSDGSPRFLTEEQYWAVDRERDRRDFERQFEDGQDGLFYEDHYDHVYVARIHEVEKRNFLHRVSTILEDGTLFVLELYRVDHETYSFIGENKQLIYEGHIKNPPLLAYCYVYRAGQQSMLLSFGPGDLVFDTASLPELGQSRTVATLVLEALSKLVGDLSRDSDMWDKFAGSWLNAEQAFSEL